MTMTLHQVISSAFPHGLRYNKAAQLCLRLFCSTDGLPKEVHEECSKEGLANVFSCLANSGFIRGDSLGATYYDAGHLPVIEKGHWLQVIASLFKAGNTVDTLLREELIACITKNYQANDELFK